MWSPSPHATAELYEELKKGREEPDATKAAAVSIDSIDEYNTDRFNPVIFDFVKRLPGVTSKNIYNLLNRVNSLSELLACSQADLADIMCSTYDAESLFESLHNHTKPLESKSSNETKFTAKNIGGSKKDSSTRFKSAQISKK